VLLMCNTTRVGSLQYPRKLLLIMIVLSPILLLPPVYSQSPLTVTVSTDKAQYSPGETVTIFGRVLDNQSNAVVGAAVSIEVNEPPIYVQLVSSDQTGSYTNQFVLSNVFPQGQYTVYVTATKGVDTVSRQTQFEVVLQTTTTSSSSSSTFTSQATPPSQCFIATAAYGSPLSPEVAMLRTFRDSEILHTFAGRSFMLAFNAFYYSFSPQVAAYITANTAIRSATKLVLYPLIGILYVSSRIFAMLAFNGEAAVILSGIFASIGIGLVYFGPLAIVLSKLRRSQAAVSSEEMHLAAASCATSIVVLMLGEILGFAGFMMLAGVLTVLSFAFLGASFAPRLARLMSNLMIRR